MASYSQYPLLDDAGSLAGFQSGLRFHNGKPKPGVYAAFRMPLYVRLVSGSRVEVFGGVRTGAAGDVVTIQSRRGHGKWANLTASTLNGRGYFDRTLSASGAAKRQFRFVFGKLSSRGAAPTKR